MATFQFLRLSLSVPPLGPLASDEERVEPKISREAFLRKLFSSRFDFFHRGKLFSYAPSPSNKPEDVLFAGFIGKQVEEAVQSGPESLFAVTKNKNWKASFVAVDVRPEEQVIAFEKRHDVGSSQSIFESLFDAYIREQKSTVWHVDVEYVQRTEEFWHAAKKFQGSITELLFEFHPPNGLRGFESFKKLDRVAKQQTNGESSTYAVRNKGGAINPKGEFVESAAEYATEGAGSIKLKAGRKTIYDSRKSKRELDAPEGLMPRQGETSKILGLIAYLFKRKP